MRCAARATSNWWVRTSYGYAVLRHAQGAALLRDRRFRQGNARWPEQNGIHSGLFSDWWKQTLLSLEGDDHARLRGLLNPAFSRKRIAAMTPSFAELATELVDAFAGRGTCEFIADFAEPYATRVLCRLLGLPEDSWPQIAGWSDDLGRSFGVRVAQDLPVIESALGGLTDYCEAVIADRARSPRDDLATAMVQARDGGLLDHRELAVAMVFLVFAGMETTRNQLGLALQTLLAHPDQWRLLGERPELGEQAVEEVMRVNPTVTWITREAITRRRLPGAAVGAGRHRAGALARRGDRPARDARPVVRHHRGEAAAPRIRCGDPPLHRAFRGQGGHGGRTPPARVPTPRPECRRARRVDADLRQYRSGAFPTAIHHVTPDGPRVQGANPFRMSTAGPGRACA